MFQYFKETAQFRSLVGALVLRHLAVRYRGSVLGFIWSFLNPLCLMLVYLLVFRYYIRFSEVPNYPIFLFCGLLPWIWFTSALAEGTASIVSSGHLITKSMFPAHILPTVAVFTTGVNFLLSLPVLAGIMYLTGAPIHWTLVLLPFVVAVELLILLGAALLLSALNVHYRDVQHVVGNVLSLLFFLCPILYSVTVVPEAWRWTLDYNPVARMIGMYHAVIIDGVAPAAADFLVCGLAGGVLFALGWFVYGRFRETFAEAL